MRFLKKTRTNVVFVRELRFISKKRYKIKAPKFLYVYSCGRPFRCKSHQAKNIEVGLLKK